MRPALARLGWCRTGRRPRRGPAPRMKRHQASASRPAASAAKHPNHTPETSACPGRYYSMGLDDVPAHLQPKVERLVQQAKAELQACGIDTTGKLPRQILRMAQIERHKP